MGRGVIEAEKDKADSIDPSAPFDPLPYGALENLNVRAHNKFDATIIVHGKDDLDPADLPVNLQYAASHIKFHKVGYRPLALNAHSPMAPLCKMSFIVCIEISF